MCMVSLYMLAILCCHTIDWDIFLRYWCLSQKYYYYYYYYLNVYGLILLFRDEQLNKEAYILQIERGQQPAKRRRRYDHVDSKLHQYGMLWSVMVTFILISQHVLILCLVTGTNSL